MFRSNPRHSAIVAILAAVFSAGCRGNPASPTTDVVDVSASVVSVVSANGGTAIDPAVGLTVTFNHGMMHADSMLVVLHEGDRAGQVVAATSSWSADRTKLTLTPSQPLEARTAYTVELRCANGDGHSSADHAAHHGGAAMGAMHGTQDGMMGGSGMGRGDMHGGAHSMTFSFTTS